jgi:class 3 adenylate cyclase/NAD(P)-dependent dehydrogenase (short-subunit alcohol dehydrogenase family)
VKTGEQLLDAMGVAADAFSGRTALITGAARGIGAATARLLAGRGCRVALVDVLDDGEQVAADIRARHGEAQFFRCDIADAARFEATLGEAGEALGPIDILFNNAVHAHVERALTLSLEEWDRGYAVNVRAPFVAIRHLLPGMLARKYGVIANMVVLDSMPYGTALGPAKAALRSTVLTVSREIGADTGVSLFNFLPGMVDTPGLRNIVAGLAAVLGVGIDSVLSTMIRPGNPGYEALVPPDHCAASLAFVMLHAREYHGQVADLFEPLARHGVLPGVRQEAPAPLHQLRAEWMSTFEAVYSQNRELEQRILVRTEQLAAAHARSEALLLNILPAPIAERLKSSAETIADSFDDVSVLFADLVGFTSLSAELPPPRIVKLLDGIFTAFDGISRDLGLEKIKTIGDCYMVVGGLPAPRSDHLDSAARAALAFREALEEHGRRSGVELQCRIGLHVGPVVAGVIGKHKFIYDLWGDTVNTASRMESHGIPGRIQCSDAVRSRLDGAFVFEERGEIDIKGKGRMRTSFLVR